MTIVFPLHLLLIIMVLLAMVSEGAYDCRESRCESYGPSIHFPFRLRHQPEYCGYPGFELSCDSKNKTILTLPNSLILFVEEIDYMSQRIRLHDPERCLILKLLHLNLSSSPFVFTVDEPYVTLTDFSVFKCSGLPADYQDVTPACASHRTIFAIDQYSFDSLPPTTCKKIHEIPSVPPDTVYSYLRLSWFNPVCRYCEGLEMDCGFKNYTKQLTTQCFNRPVTTKGGLKEPLIAEVLSSNFGKASHKSDVYSFGMMLLEMVGGRKNFDTKADTSQVNFPEWIHQRLNQEEELKIRIEEDDDIIIVRKLAIIGLWCIQWNATDRPSIKVVTQMLEGDGNNLNVPPPFTARNSSPIGTEGISKLE
ncbi:hypothetical protein HAX54_031551 [Datura stramonium]|uniref:RING-type E3 ubiquitin transferase n=1 Tax=Datura stramonium TaxID=4076 RepID=A0ABS8RH82_DATST|nr:hypothetical protein [Datura stramonium]